MVEGKKEILIYFLFYLIAVWPIWTIEVMEFEPTVRSRSKLKHLNLHAGIQVR